MEHIPAMHAAKVGMRYPARVTGITADGLRLHLDLSALAPGRFPFLEADLLYDETADAERARALDPGESVEVVLVEVGDVHGALFVSLPVDPAWLAWNNGTVRQLAGRIRETGEYVLLPVLADALEEAGCTDPALLAKCRERPVYGARWLVTLLAAQE